MMTSVNAAADPGPKANMINVPSRAFYASVRVFNNGSSPVDLMNMTVLVKFNRTVSSDEFPSRKSFRIADPSEFVVTCPLDAVAIFTSASSSNSVLHAAPKSTRPCADGGLFTFSVNDDGE